ncbi:MAG: glycosyltransferase [Sedimenticolaceae bacterium]
MSEVLKSKRILIYSHDSFGLGHLRRCRAIAHALVERFKGLTVLILSGSPIIANFDFRARVDFIRIPGVIKLYNGDYTSMNLHIDLKETLTIRESIIRHTAQAFGPDILLVDKEPLGLMGEMADTLKMLRATKTRLILGVRDVMDDPDYLKEEWANGEAINAMENLYDEIWVYGHEQFIDPLDTLDVPPAVREKMTFTGYLQRDLPKDHNLPKALDISKPYMLVTAGGGGDGLTMMDWVVRAYESGSELPYPALIVLGPFMPHEVRDQFMARCHDLDQVHTITFDSRMEVLIANAACVVAMAGYNTFCEVLSFDRPALFIPRTSPRKEQLVRAIRASELGLSGMLVLDREMNTTIMVQALRSLAERPAPSTALNPGMLGGLTAIGDIVHQHLGEWLDAEGAVDASE